MANNPVMFKEFKQAMIRKFEMTDNGFISYLLICQEAYTKAILKRFKVEDCKLVCTPIKYGTKLSKHGDGMIVKPTYFKSLIESLRYLICIRLAILYGVGLISHFMEEPKSAYLKAAKQIIRYIKHTFNHGFFYSVSNNFRLVGYSNSD